MTREICLIVPCYNEAKRIRAEFFVSDDKKIDTLVLVNDGSHDDTAAVLGQIQQRLQGHGVRVVLVTLAKNQGKGEAVRQGMLRGLQISQAPFFALMDADNSTPLSEILRLSEHVRSSQVPVIQGARVALSGRLIQRSTVRHYLGRFGATLITLLLGLNIYDTQAGAKVFHRSAVPTLFQAPFLSRWLFDCEVLLRAKRAGYRVIEEPLWCWRHVKAGSAVNGRVYLVSFWDLLRIAWSERRH